MYVDKDVHDHLGISVHVNHYCYRCSLMGFDLNRHWHDPSLWAHPTLHATKKLVMDYDQDPVREWNITK